MIVAIVLFALAAAGGLVLARQRFTNKPLPMPLALLHGALAAAGIVALLIGVLGGAGPGSATVALVLFVVAALGGFTLFSFHLRRRTLPLPIVVVHALVAVTAFVVLLVGVLRAG